MRFVQLYSGGGHLEDTWDGHTDCIANHTLHAGETDQPIAALIADLKRTGPVGRDAAGLGRRVRPHADERRRRQAGPRPQPATASRCGWPAPGVKGGQAIGATDELGFDAVEDRCHVSDLHATILHLMGLDHEQLTYFHGGLRPAADRACAAR